MKQRMAYWIEEASRVLNPRPGREATTAGIMAWTLEGLGYDPRRCFLAPTPESLDDRLHQAILLQLEHYRRVLADQTVIVFWVFEDFLSNTQQVEVAREILNDGRYPVVFLVTNRWESLEAFHVDEVFCGHQLLYIPDRSLIGLIDFAKVFWAIDCLYDTTLPPGSVRLLQPHGTDISFDYSVEFYGAGLLFDFLLSPSFSPEVFRPDFKERYEGLLPLCLADHSGPALHAIEAGSFKLDVFARRCRQSTPSDIIYNLSAWSLEHIAVKRELTALLQEILERHPHRRLVFRCFPGDEGTVRPHIAPLLGHPRFFWSTAPNYLDDYAAGVVLIHHRGSTAEIFSVASGRPSIKLDYSLAFSPRPIDTPVGCIVHDKAQLMRALDDYVRLDSPKCLDILSLRERKYPNLGQGLQLVLDSIPRMLAKNPDPAWRTLPLAPTPDGMPEKEFVRGALLEALRRDILIPILAERAVRLLPDSALVRFYAAKSILTHVYPDPLQGYDSWSTAAEHLAAYFRLLSNDIPEDLRQPIRDWTVRFLPARLLGLVGWSVHRHDQQQRASLEQAFRGLPLGFFDTDGIPQRMEEARERSESESRLAEGRLRELSRVRERYLPSPLLLDAPQGPEAPPVYLGDPFLPYRARWDRRLAPVAAAPAAHWQPTALEDLEALNERLRTVAGDLTTLLCGKLDAVHPDGPRGSRFWTKALGMGILETTHLLWQCFDLFEAGFRPGWHDAILLETAGYHIPLDFDDLRWFLQHSDFGMEQAFSVYVRALHPDHPCRYRMLRYANPYRVRSVGEPTRHDPVVGILGAFPAQPYMEALVSGSRGRIQRIGFRRELNLYDTLPDIARRLDLMADLPEGDRFTRFLKACLPWLLPKSMLENFATLERSIEQDLAPHARLTHVVSEFWIGESYECIALAVLSRRGVLHVYNEHVMSCAPFIASPMRDHLAVCDVYAGCATLAEGDIDRYARTGSLYDFAATSPSAKPPRKCTYFSAKPFARATGHGGLECAIGRGPWAVPYYEFKRRFFSALPRMIKGGLTYRRYPFDDFFKLATLVWDDESMMQGCLDGCLPDDHACTAREAIASSDIVITDQFSTTVIESIALGRPTLVLLHTCAVFAPPYASVMEQLRECGIVQCDPEAAAALLERIWNVPRAWWDSEEVRAARQRVLDLFRGRPERMVDMLLDLAGREQAPLPETKDLRSFICPNPFLYGELKDNGDVVPCCYYGGTFGNIHKAPLAEIWNSAQARALRASVLDGSYRYCDRTRCAGMQKALLADNRQAPASYQTPYELFHREQLRRSGFAWIEGWTSRDAAPAPAIVSLEDDPTCNLSCPSCRKAPMRLSREKSAGLEAAHAELLARLDERGGELWICGAGDPFASRAYRKLLRGFDPVAHPRIRFRIDTNGVLLTPDMWGRTLGRYPERISLLCVSVDAATAATYDRLRRGGNWELLQRNLGFLGRKRRDHPEMLLILRMIVQRDNFREMGAFVEMARRLRADRAVFSALENWGSFEEKDWAARAVHRPDNPLFPEFLAKLRDPALIAPDVDLGNLTMLSQPETAL